jgi:hypothetical protein
MNRELATSFKTRIGEKHAEGQRLDDLLRDVVLRKLNTAREVGILLEDAKDALGYGPFCELQKDLDLSHDCVVAYTSFARKHSEPITDFQEAIGNIKSACQASGLLALHPGHSQQSLHQKPSFFSQIADPIAKLMAAVAKREAGQPLRKWPTDFKAQVAQTLLPVVKLHKRLLE